MKNLPVFQDVEMKDATVLSYHGQTLFTLGEYEQYGALIEHAFEYFIGDQPVGKHMDEMAFHKGKSELVPFIENNCVYNSQYDTGLRRFYFKDNEWNELDYIEGDGVEFEEWETRHERGNIDYYENGLSIEKVVNDLKGLPVVLAYWNGNYTFYDLYAEGFKIPKTPTEKNEAED